MPEIGTKLSSGSGVTWMKIGVPSTNNMRALFSWVQQEPAIAYRLGFWGRRDGTNNPKPQVAIYEGSMTALPINGMYVPTNRLGYTAPFNVSAGSGSAGALYDGVIFASSRDGSLGVTGAGILLVPGKRYVLVIHNEGAALEVAIPSGTPTNLYYFQKGVAAGDPPPQYSTVGTPAQGARGALYATYQVSTPPTTTITAPAASISTTTPTFIATTSDPDRVGTPNKLYDRLGAYTIELRKFGETALVWNPEFTVLPGSVEKSTGTINRLYTGSTPLVPGTYQVRIQATDDTGAVGDFTAWHNFTIANLPVVETDIVFAPSGKQESGVVSQFQAKWVSPAGKHADGVKVRIKSGGQIIRSVTTAFVTLTPTVAPNGTITISDTLTKLTQGTVNGVVQTPLDSGVYTWEMMARDTDGITTLWSDPVEFRVNYAPLQPSAIRPISGTRVELAPRVDWLLQDPDEEDVPGVDVTSEYRLTQVATGIITASGETSSYDTATGRGFVALQAASMPADGFYNFEVRGIDRSARIAGGAALATAYSGWSGIVQIEKITAPTVTILAPTEGQVFVTASPQISFTVGGTGMLYYRVELYDPADVINPTFGSGWIQAINTLSGQYTIPPGVLTNGAFYRVRVVTRGADEIESYSGRVLFRVLVPEADLIQNFNAVEYKDEIDHESVTVQLSWTGSSLQASQFAGYVITRRTEDQPLTQAVTIAHIKQASQTMFFDYHAPANTQLTYSIVQLKRSGSDIQLSPLNEATITLNLTVPVLASMFNGKSLRSPVIMLSTDYTEGFSRDEVTLATWGNQGKPTLVRSPEGYGQRVYGVGFRIRSDARGTIKQHMSRWRDMVRSGHPFSFRTETETVYVRIVPEGGWLQRSSRGGAYEVSLALEEIAYSEAVKVVT